MRGWKLKKKFRRNGIKEEWHHRPTLLEICLAVRMSLNGSSEPYPGEDWLKEVRDMLSLRLDAWQPTVSVNEFEQTFDAHIFRICSTTVAYINKELERK